MSLFVAVRPDESAIEDLDDLLSRVRRDPAARDLRWQPPGHWHVTLAFLGDPDDLVADEIAERLRPLSAVPAVRDLRLQGAGQFGGQVIWMGLAPGPGLDALGILANRIPPLMRGSGAIADWRPWRAHLTVARARRGTAGRVVDTLAGYSGPPWDAAEVLLIRSSGGPHPAHQVLMHVPLDGASPAD